MTTLARGLVLDESAADDVVQQALVDVIERPPERPRSLGAWLRTVVGNRARKNRRSALRQRRREVAVARPERLTRTPADVVERAELHRLVVDSVLALPEPYREAILLRYFEDLSAVEVAERQNVPLATARSRLQRGLDRLRRELDVVHGDDRARWLTGLAVIAGLDATLLSGSSTAAAASAPVGAACQSAVFSAAAQGGIQTLAIGGVIVTQKTALTIAILSAATLLLGGAIGHYTTRMNAEDAKMRFQLVEEAKVSDLETQLAATQTQLKSADAERDRLKTEKAGLAARVDGLDSELKAEREKAKAEEVVAEQRKLGLAFGSYSDLEGLTSADWPELGGAVKTMNGLFLELLADLEKGKPIGPELQQKIVAENAKLVRLAAGIMGKIPTHAPVNGEFSHPLVLANLMSAVLEESGMPLTKAQKEAVMRAGGGYDAAYEKLQKGYNADTSELEKLVDELSLKQDSVKKVRGSFSAEQLEAVLPQQLRDLMQLDVLSPGISTALSAQPKSYSSAEEARSKFQKNLLKELGVASEAAGGFDEHFAAWQEEVQSLLTPRGEKAGPPRFDDALLAARAEANLLRKLLATPGLDDKARAAIIAFRTWTIPQISEKKE